MSKLYICLIVLLLPLIALGQGFKGKTLTITPHISGFYLGDNEDLLNNVITANFDVEKVFNRSNSFGLRAFTGLNKQSVNWDDRGFNRGQFTAYGYGVFLRRYFFNRGAIAPLGAFFQLGASRHIYDIVDEREIEVARVKTLVGSMAFGVNWFLGKNVLLFSGLEAKYELPNYPEGTSVELAGRFNDELRESLPISFKLGITIPIL